MWDIIAKEMVMPWKTVEEMYFRLLQKARASTANARDLAPRSAVTEISGVAGTRSTGAPSIGDESNLGLQEQARSGLLAPEANSGQHSGPSPKRCRLQENRH
jgi:hypothetical protein